MVNIIMHGCNGKMGQVITRLVGEDEDTRIVCGIDIYDDGHNDYPVFKNFEECTIKGDVVIDFSSAKAVDALLDFCEKSMTPVVLCSTGLSEEQIKRTEDISSTVAVLRSANMSLGINTLMKVLKSVAPLFAEAGFDIEIVEKHHRLKLDAPSGTAIALADSINETLPEKYEYKFDRSGDRMQRPKKQIGISSVRGGTIVGEHEVIFAGEDEVVEFKHTAYSKNVFAKGAIEAAKFLKGKEPGLYTMKEVIG